ncbi:MAG: 16S rRNA (cytidine(1402)-2'-O)-methyltransferase [Chloroflexi bacterium]|nr:16S rRNA (cytidine(1402)-2'-O)-methyltransferase [Chloroflexota bacterium]
MGTLFIVATPIGNLEDLSPRAARILREVGLIAAEDTRVTRKLLNHINAATRTLSYHEHSGPRSAERVLKALDAGDVALVTDAGSPVISDPGAALIDLAFAAGHQIVTVPGPSAVTAALSVSGFAADSFTFIGFLPRNKAAREAALRSARDRPRTTVCFEAPHRIRKTLEQMVETLPDRPISVSRELSKLHEETYRGTPAGALAHFEEPRGEFAIVISGAETPGTGPSDAEIVEAVAELRSGGLAGRSLVDRATARTGASRSRVYRLELDTRRDG